jgi:hypothetical protein
VFEGLPPALFARALTAQPDVDAGVSSARAAAITRRREESIVTASCGMRVRAMQICDASIAAIPVRPPRLIVVQARIVIDSIVRPPFLRGFALGLCILRSLPATPLGARILCLAKEGPDSHEREGGQKYSSGSYSHIGLR